MLAIYKKELKTYMTSMIGWIFIAGMLIITGIFSTAINFSNLYPNFEYVISSVSFVYLIIVPILTMRAVAEERRQKTEQLLYSLPISLSKVILGKYLALVTILLAPTLVMCSYPLVLSMFGTVAFGASYGAIVGFFFLGCSLIAVGIFISTLTENQIIAATLCFGALLLFFMMTGIAGYVPSTAYASFIAFTALVALLGVIIYFMTKNPAVSVIAGVAFEIPLVGLFLFNPVVLEGSFRKVITSLSVFDRLENFIYGVFDITGIVYYITVAFLFVFFSIQSLEKRRWS